MRTTRKTRNQIRMALQVVCISLVVALACLLAWVFFIPKVDHTAPSAQAPSVPIHAMTHNTDTLALATTIEAQQAWAVDTVDFAVSSGMNSIFVPVYNAQTQTILHRDKAYETFATITANDTFFKKFDALTALCDTASTQNIAVYAYVDKAQLSDTMHQSLTRLAKRYAVAGVCTYDAIANTFTDVATQQSITAFTPTSVYAYTDLFLQTVQSGAQDTVFVHGVAAPDTALALAQFNASTQIGTLPTLEPYVPTGALTITSPADGSAQYSDTLYVMGESDPNVPLLLNGTPVERTTQTGVFGTFVTLQLGENTFTLTNGNGTQTVTVTRKTWGSGSGSNVIYDDATQAVPAGTYVQTKNWITSLLYDPSSDGNINETVRKGAVLQVVDCVQTVRSGKNTWAYQLASGDYVLAYNTEVVGDSIVQTQYTHATATQTKTGETLQFVGTGTPVAYTNRIDNTLQLIFYGADIAPDFTVQNSTLVQSTAVTKHDTHTEVTLTFAQPLWGHSLEYENGSVVVLLKTAPVRSDVPNQPLQGVSILLDAGHGADDVGAVGTAGAQNPTEKNANLSVVLATKYRLEQLGATVHTVRTDDTFLTLTERNELITQLQPDLFLSVHHNAMEWTTDLSQNFGTECYYFYNESKPFAQSLVQNFVTALGRYDRGAKWGYYYVARNTICPAVLLEIGFMGNPNEYEQVTLEQNYWRSADAIVQSVLAMIPHA